MVQDHQNQEEFNYYFIKFYLWKKNQNVKYVEGQEKSYF